MKSSPPLLIWAEAISLVHQAAVFRKPWYSATKKSGVPILCMQNRKKVIFLSKYPLDQGCGSGFIQSGSGSSIFPQSGSGSTKFLNPDPMRIRIHKGKFEEKFFLLVLKINIKVKNTCSLYYFLPFSYKNV
jgi:hypothetical protein